MLDEVGFARGRKTVYFVSHQIKTKVVIQLDFVAI